MPVLAHKNMILCKARVFIGFSAFNESRSALCQKYLGIFRQFRTTFQLFADENPGDVNGRHHRADGDVEPEVAEGAAEAGAAGGAPRTGEP